MCSTRQDELWDKKRSSGKTRRKVIEITEKAATAISASGILLDSTLFHKYQTSYASKWSRDCVSVAVTGERWEK